MKHGPRAAAKRDPQNLFAAEMGELNIFPLNLKIGLGFLECFSPPLSIIYWKEGSRESWGRSINATPEETHPDTFISPFVQPTLWCNENLWLYCITANKSIWRKRHLVKGHSAMECNAAMCNAAYKKTLGKYCTGQTYDPTFSRNRATYWMPSESAFSVSTLLFDAMPPHTSIRATVI
ncbi:uncharacterized protein LOC134760756 [Pongo abelii]|uniref:uncharacterized protein LOC134760756 n=1 Tax=Pongo abelii TaxID=9601 RepID=UPI0030049E4D